MRFGLVLVVLALASVPASLVIAQDGPGPTTTGPATTTPRTSSDIVAMLSGFETAPRPEAWRALGPDVVPLLRAVATDARQPGFVRLRAVHALAAFHTPAVRTELRRLVRSPEPLVAREAGLAMARAFGAGAEADVATLLAHDDVAVREGAIEALAGIGTASARARLEAHLAREPDAALRERIEDRLRGGVESSPDEGEGTR